MNLGLKEKRALVTGSSRGLGFAVALGLLKEGASVMINSRSESNLNTAVNKLKTEVPNGDVGFTVGDVTDPVVTQELINKANQMMGGLDILVTNSGGPPAGAFESFNDQIWAEALELSLMSHVRLIRSALWLLRQSTAPSVLTMTSISVKQPIPNLVLSNSIRSAVVGLTKTLALELGSDGIRFNSILPSWTSTQRVVELMEYRAKSNNTSVDFEMNKQAMESPLKRMATPEEFANVAVFLASPASSYLTGAMIPVDGGMYKGTY